MKTTRVLNMWCKEEKHESCPGASKGDASDRVNFECICPCHKPKEDKK